MVRRRRRRHFSGSVHEHRKMARGLAPDMRSWVREFRAVMGKRGATYGRKCHEALDLLVGAARSQARYDQERAWGARGRLGLRKGSTHAITKMKRAFYHSCVVAPR